MKCAAEDKQWGERRESWEKVVTIQETTIAKVRHEPDRKLPKRSGKGYPSAMLQKPRLSAKEAAHILEMVLLSRKPWPVVSPLRDLFGHSEILLKLQQGNIVDPICPGTGMIQARKTAGASTRDQEAYNEILLVILQMVGRNRCLAQKEPEFIEGCSRFQEL